MIELQTDQELVLAANSGDVDAMTAIYERHASWVLATARQQCENLADAEDVTQEAFRYFFAKFPGFVLTSQIRTYLYPVIRNRAIDLARKRRRQVSDADETRHAATQASTDEFASRSRLADMVARLSAGHREVVLLRFGEGLRLNEIAEQLQLPLGTVKSRLHHALIELRRQERA